MSKIIEWAGHCGTLHHGNQLESKGEYQVLDCDLCGFKHVIPIPDEKFLEEYYSTQYFGKRGDEYIRKHENEYEWNKILFVEKYDYFKKHITANEPSLLDIGCSLGLFLKAGMERDWELMGIEPGVELSKYAKNLGLTVENKFLTMTEVLEHIREPNKMIEYVVEMINPGGLLSITCPNDFNPLQTIFTSQEKIEPWWVAPPEHLNYFDIGSIKSLLENMGLQVIETTVSFPLEFFLLMGENYIGNNDIGSSIHNKRMNLELNLLRSGNESLRRDLYKKFAELDLGREFTVIARKT